MTRPALRRLIPLLALSGLPLAAQAWDLRLEGIQGSAATAETGQGLILSGAHRIVRVNPVLKLEWGVEATDWKADGPAGTTLRQRGLGLGLNAQFWVPFSGLAAETALIQRLQESGPEGHLERHGRAWFRAGLRWRLPLASPGPYLAASWQTCLAPPAGAPVERLWSLGAGFSF